MQEIWHYMPTRVLRKYFLGIYKKVIGQKLILDYMDSDYQKHEKTVEDEEYVRNFYKLDYLRWSRYN